MRLRTREISVQADFKYGNQRFRVSLDTMDHTQGSGVRHGAALHIRRAPPPAPVLARQVRQDHKGHRCHTEHAAYKQRPDNRLCQGRAAGGTTTWGRRYTTPTWGCTTPYSWSRWPLKSGYWGLGGGSSMRNHFVMQASANRYKVPDELFAPEGHKSAGWKRSR